MRGRGAEQDPARVGDRVKTDRRDAEHLVRLLLAGKRHAVRVAGAREEALRDLVRPREAVRVDLMRNRQRLSKLLLRHGHRFDDGSAWTERHRAWLGTVDLGWPAAQAVLLDLRGVDTLTAVGLCAEIGDFERFAQAGQLMSYVGLVTSESTTGQKRRLADVRMGRTVPIRSYADLGPGPVRCVTPRIVMSR